MGEQGRYASNSRREIQFGLIPTTTIDGPDQTQSLLYVKFMLEHGGFLRDNGLNSLPSIKKLSNILNLPNGFNFDIKVESIASLCKKNSQHTPMVLLKTEHTGRQFFHVAVLKEAKIYKHVMTSDFVVIKNTWKDLDEFNLYLDQSKWSTFRVNSSTIEFIFADTRCIFVDIK